MESRPVRRIVTGHDDLGWSIIQKDGPVSRIRRIGGAVGPVFQEIWNTSATPVPIDAASGEPEEDDIVLAPPANGTRIRVLDIPPDDPRLARTTPEEARALFAEIGAADASSRDDPGSRHAHMHRIETVDYCIVLEGELVLIMDDGETTVRAGDIVIQRGTNHAWSNRSGADCRIVFVMVDGVYDRVLKA